MKKLLLYGCVLILAVGALTACGGEAKNETSQVVVETGDPIETEYGTVSLMKGYDALSGEQTKVIVDDGELDSRVQSMLESVSQYEQVDRAAQENDYVYLAMTMIVGDEIVEDYSEEPYSVLLGDMEYGEEFDQKITGLKPGDPFDFTIDYTGDEDAYYSGELVQFVGDVDYIEELSIPELTEDYAMELGYDSIADMRDSLSHEVETELSETYLSQCKEALIQQVLDYSKFEECDENIYQTVLSKIKEEYTQTAEMFDMELGELLESFYGMKEEDLETEALNTVHRYAMVLAIAQEQELMVTDEDYDAGLAAYAEEAGYESAKDMESDYGEDNIRFWLLEDKVVNYLYEHASITEVEPVEESETNEISESD